MKYIYSTVDNNISKLYNEWIRVNVLGVLEWVIVVIVTIGCSYMNIKIKNVIGKE